jgi:hypothetical protein
MEELWSISTTMVCSPSFPLTQLHLQLLRVMFLLHNINVINGLTWLNFFFYIYVFRLLTLGVHFTNYCLFAIEQYASFIRL